MSTSIERVVIEHGELHVANGPDAVMLMRPSTTARHDELQQVLNAVADSDADRVGEALTSFAAGADCTSIAAVVRDGDDWVVMTKGDMRCTVQTPTSRLTIDARTGRLDQRRCTDVEQVSFFPNQELPLEASAGTSVASGSSLAGRVTVTMADRAATPESPDSPVALTDVEFIDLNAPPEPRKPLDIGAAQQSLGHPSDHVPGVECASGHHNHPDAITCAQCGQPIAEASRAAVKLGPRPPLGLLIIDDGATFSLVADVVVGREPSGHRDVLAGSMVALQIIGDAATMSRAHLGVYLDGWTVTAMDLGSANGTTLRRSTGELLSVPTDAKVALATGDTLVLGERHIRLELHHDGAR